jgi:serine-protein kinase ATM
MEQVFQLMNILLKKDRETDRRSLQVRTYKVVPLSMQAAVLEFVNDTNGIGNWLLTAHAKCVKCLIVY